MAFSSFNRPFSNIFTVLAVLLFLNVAAPSTSAQPLASGPETHFADAMQMRSDGLLEDAVASFERFRTAHPGHVLAGTALYYQAELSLQLGRSDEAVRMFAAFQRDYPAHPLAFEAQVALANHFFETGDRERGVLLMERVLELNPPPDVAARALYRMGQAAVEAEQFEDAILYYRRAAEGYRETDTAPMALYAIGFTQMRRERYDEAASAFEILTARYPASSYAKIVGIALAEVYYELEDYTRAIRELEARMPQLGPEAQERATFLLAESYNQLGDRENAIVYYRRFTEQNQNSLYYPRALYGLAWNYHFEGIHEWAAEHFELAREAASEVDLEARATYYEAVSRRLDRRPEDAIQLYRDFLFRWPNHDLAPHAQLEYAVTLYDQRQWREAHSAFDQVIRVYPESDVVGEALFYRGNTAVALGNYDEALQHFDRAAEHGTAPPELADEILFQKAWLQYRNQNYAEAARAFIERYRDNPRARRAEESLFWAAESNYQLGNHQQAEELFRQYLRDFTDGRHVEAATYALGWVYFKMGRYEAAATHFASFLNGYRSENESVPYRADARLRLADSYYALKRYGDAIRAYTDAANDGHEYALYQVGQAHYNNGNPGRAIASFQSLLREYPDGEWVEEATYSIGYLQFQNEQYDEAIETYNDLIQSFPRDPLAARAQYGIGDAHFNAGRSDEAASAYQRVLERYPNSEYVPDAAAGLQYALAAEGDEGRMTAVIDSFAMQNPNSPVLAQLRFRHAEVKYQSGRRDEALSDFMVFLEAHRESPLAADASFYVANIYEARGDGDRARSFYERVISRDDASARAPEAAWELGQLYLEQGRNEEALSVFRRMGEMRSRDGSVTARAGYGEGVALLNLGRSDEAERLLSSAIEAAGSSDDALPPMLGLARVYEGQGRTDEAAELLRRVGERSRDEIGAEALFRLGSLQLERGDELTAIETLSRIPVLFPGFEDWVARSYLTQARAFGRLGQSGDATRLYDCVIAEFGGSPYAQTATREKASL
ncbi:MAG: outer membrane protein assembly factor BamD [Bacteroidota bacterium]